MIKATIPVTWTEKDYQYLPWVCNPIPEEKFNATVDTTNLNVGVYMCYDEKILSKFYSAVEMLPLEKKVVAVNKFTPGQILPFHSDKYEEYKRRNNIKHKDQDQISRYIVFLHDQKAGHQLWIEDQICTGPAGSAFGWRFGTEHMAANLGHEDRYVLQVTGINV
tara:strand:+ start:1056 stop:1547 length:492 start_codon:yes stop_codon:yes gene_type:complete